MKVFIILLVVLLLAIACVGCSSTPISPTSSPIDMLNYTETKVYKSVLEAIEEDYARPEIVRLIEVSEGWHAPTVIRIITQGEMKDGVRNKIYYELKNGNVTEILESDFFSLPKVWTDSRVGAINNALEEHWKILGIK